MNKNDYQIVIEGHIVKELRCKNDDCRALLGYENVMLGVMIFTCPKCQKTSVFKMQYRLHGKELISKLQNKFEEGGEKQNG